MYCRVEKDLSIKGLTVTLASIPTDQVVVHEAKEKFGKRCGEKKNKKSCIIFIESIN